MFVAHFVRFALILLICRSEFCHGEEEQQAKDKLQGMFCGVAHLLNNYANFLLFFSGPVLVYWSIITDTKDPSIYNTAKQRLVKKGVQWLFPLCTDTPGHNQ